MPSVNPTDVHILILLCALQVRRPNFLGPACSEAWGESLLIESRKPDRAYSVLCALTLQAGIKLNSLTSTELSEALIKATTDTLMKETAARVGEKIRSEDGVGEAISFLYSYIERARAYFTPLSHRGE